jgi:hypothetical protein
LRTATTYHDKGNNTVADQGQQCHCYEGNDAIYTMARMPAHRQCKDTIIMRGTIAIAITAKTLRINRNNAIVMRATMPAR